MTCAGLEDRLLEEDCHAALLGRGPTPDDVERHLVGCPNCTRLWSQARADERRLSQELLLAPPAALRRRLYRAFGLQSGRQGAGADAAAVCRTLVAGALGASLAAGTVLTDRAGFCVGASVGLAWVAMQRAPQHWRQPVVSAARALRGCVQVLRSI